MLKSGFRSPAWLQSVWQSIAAASLSQRFFSLLLVAVLLSGCGDLMRSGGNRPASPDAAAIATGAETTQVKALTIAQVEGAIAQNLPKEIGVPIQSVTCPKPIIIEAGKVFDCTAKIAQGSFPVKVTVKDAEGNLNFKTRQILLLSEAETKLQQSIKKIEKVDVKADCGGKVKLFQKVGESFQCKLTSSNGKTGTATITAISEEGKVDAKWKL